MIDTKTLERVVAQVLDEYLGAGGAGHGPATAEGLGAPPDKGAVPASAAPAVPAVPASAAQCPPLERAPGKPGAAGSTLPPPAFAAPQDAALYTPAAPAPGRPVPADSILSPPACAGPGMPAGAAPEKDGLQNPAALLRMKSRTPARIGVRRAGPRLRTATLLALRADHAGARDSAFTDVDPACLQQAGLHQLQSRCGSRQEHITRPDLGRRLADDSLRWLEQNGETGRDVQVIVSDGLSSRAVEANVANLLPVLMEGLQGRGITAGKPFYVRYGRVAVEDEVAELLKPKLVCLLIGERPGLATAESLSAYLCYGARVGQPESRRTVVSNIHAGGIPAVEAGAYLVDLCQKLLEQKASGVEAGR